MPRKSSLGYPTIIAAETAVREIVNQYSVNQEFFHPLLQRLFVEQPYWCDPPGPVFIKFKWMSHELLTGAITERWFYAYSDDPEWRNRRSSINGGWASVSWRKAVRWFKFNLDLELKEVARNRVSVIARNYRENHPFCEHTEAQGELADHVHHVVPMRQIIAEALAILTPDDRVEIQNFYDWWSEKQFMLSDDHKFMQYILQRHKPGSMLSLCRKHHNDMEGKKTHS